MLGILRRWWTRWLPLGRRGEREAEAFLIGQGFRIVARNYMSALGEIDLIVIDGETLVIVEVRTRGRSDKGEAWETVGAVKQRKLTRLATDFLQRETRWQSYPVRFDIISVHWTGAWREKPAIRHIMDAFSARGPWLT